LFVYFSWNHTQNINSDTTDIPIETPMNRQIGKLLYNTYYGGYRLKALIVLLLDGFIYACDLMTGDIIIIYY